MPDMNHKKSVVKINIGDLNTPNKIQRLSVDKKKTNMMTTCCLCKTHLNYNNIYRLKIKGWKKKQDCS